MPPTLSERFIKARTQPIEFEGKLVYSKWPLPVYPKQIVYLYFINTRTDIRQGISLDIKKGAMELREQGAVGFFSEIDRQRMRRAILWCDTDPPRMEVRCYPGRKPTTLWIYNSWAAKVIGAKAGKMFGPEESDIWGIDAGINNSGMIVLAQTDKLIRLGCSPGVSSFDPPDFNALIIELTFGSEGDRVEPNAVERYGAEGVKRIAEEMGKGFSLLGPIHETIPDRKRKRKIIEQWPSDRERMDPYSRPGY
jgi:hypothetical protein